LVVVRQHEIVIVRSVSKGPVDLVRPLLPAARKLQRQGFRLSIGGSAVHDGPAGLRDAYAEASAAVELSRARGGVFVLAELRAFDYLTLTADRTAERLVAPGIRTFASDDSSNGGVFAETLRAYVAADLNAKAAAERLMIHVNTVHYRLGRIAEKTNCDLRKLADVVDVLLAVQMADARSDADTT
jgi:DNA-binding PucR family transcriptional regulator